MSLSIALNIAILALLALLAGWTLINRKRPESDDNSRLAELGRQLESLGNRIDERLRDSQDRQQQLDTALREGQADARHALERRLGELQTAQEKRHGETLKATQDTLAQGMATVQKQVADALGRYAEDLGKRVEVLTKTTDDRLKDISGQVEKRLDEGFEKTTATFADVLKRLALIDEAQKKITELSGNVVSLQEILSDKRSRGAFGEVQLNALIRNVMPESNFSFQHELSNKKRADCILFLPEPTGNVVIDAKFPLESYQRMTDIALGEADRKLAEKQFRIDIKKHIHDIADKYIIPGETSDGAMMFLPAEAVFAEIQAHQPELVQEAMDARVWMVSPTTMMAILNTARAVLKDAATREQVHIIQQHLSDLALDFGRFQKRMDSLAKHIDQANRDVEDVNKSARKISSRFEKIEKVELDDPQLEDEPEQPLLKTERKTEEPVD